MYWIIGCMSTAAIRARAILDDDMHRRLRQHVTVIPRAISDAAPLGSRRRACQRSSTTIQPGAGPVASPAPVPVPVPVPVPCQFSAAAAVGIRILASPRFVPLVAPVALLTLSPRILHDLIIIHTSLSDLTSLPPTPPPSTPHILAPSSIFIHHRSLMHPHPGGHELRDHR